MKSKGPLKVVFVGLAGAGKTSIILAIDRNYEELSTVTPTRNVSTTEMKLLGLHVVRWDFGGQEQYRKRHLEQFEKYFAGAEVFFFVVSVRDPGEFEAASSFLKALVKALGDKRPTFAVLLHKFDPGARDDPDVQRAVVEARRELGRHLRDFPHEFWETSVFYPSSVHAAFTETLLSRFPGGELVSIKLGEVAGELGASAVALHDAGGFVFGRHVVPRSQIEDVVAFFEFVDDASQRVDPNSPTEMAVFALSERADVAMSVFPVRKDAVVFSALLPAGRMAADPGLQERFRRAAADLGGVLKIW
ncbi:MAG: hypothetical protein Kow0069_18320 [Promethearchaeota archaeon]